MLATLRILLAAGIVSVPAFLLANPSAACSDGADCYCDRVRDPGSSIHDPDLVLCEDFEASTLHDDGRVGGGAPLYGPWYDDTGYPGARGNNSYWHQHYGSSVGACAWRNGQPSSPTRGTTCAFGSCFPGEWRADNRWQANGFACLDIVRDGEFDDEVTSLADPAGPGGSSGVLDGRQSLAFRTAPGATGGIVGSAPFGHAVTSFGITMAVAYPANSLQAGIWNAPWKHNEWVAVETGQNDGSFLFHNEFRIMDQSPFLQFMRYAPGMNDSHCSSALSRADIRLGDLRCVGGDVLYVRADPGAYRRSRDFPLGTWACVRGHFQNLDSSQASIEIWFNDTKVIDVRDLDANSFLQARRGYNALLWNNYSNTNQGFGNVPTNQTTYRYEDNVHITEGPPVSCNQIGFSGLPAGSPPDRAPILLQ